MSKLTEEARAGFNLADDLAQADIQSRKEKQLPPDDRLTMIAALVVGSKRLADAIDENNRMLGIIQQKQSH